MAIHSPLLSRKLFADHRAGQRHPARWIQLLNKTEKAPRSNLYHNIRGKLPKDLKVDKMPLIKLLSDYFLESSRCVFGQFLEKLKINRKPWENDLGPISETPYLRKKFRKCNLCNS